MTEIITDYLDAKQLADRLTALELNSTSELARLERERDEAREEIKEWKTLCLWGGTTEHIHGFIRGQQSRIQHLERERDEAFELLASEKTTRNHIIKRSVEVERERDEAREEAHRFRSLSYARSGIDKSASWFPWETSLNLAQKAQLLATEKHAK